MSFRHPIALFLCLLPFPILAKSVGINFSTWPTVDAHAVNPGEISINGIAGTESVDGSKWNNIDLRGVDALGTPTVFTSATQGANHINLIDSTGADSAIDLTSSGAFYSNIAAVSAPNQASTGDAGLMNSYLLLSNTESVTLTGIAAWAPYGYRVRAFFDIGPFTRNYGITMHDGGAPQTFWTADSAGTDSDTNNDGSINWVETTATTEATAVADANNALFGPFTGNTLTISGISPATRAALNGLQIIPYATPPATIVSFTATPASFTAGQNVTLQWQVTNADSVSINQGIGTVTASGSAVVQPTASTTWTLTATRGGNAVTAQATATLSLGPIDVYLLSGQSNMQGTASSAELPSGLTSIPEIMLYAGGTGVQSSIANKWVTLRPANGGTFGPEIGIGEKMRDLCPGRPIALLKYAVSGNSLEIDFKPGANTSDTANWGPSFTGLVNTVNAGLASLVAAGWQPVVKGMCWQQGEADAKDGLNVPESSTSADDYGANLSHFVSRIRTQFSAYASPDGIRFVPGQVLPYAPAGGDVVTRFPGRDLVRQAILDADENSGAPLSIPNSRSIPTNSIDHPVHEQEVVGNTDEVHLGAPAQLHLGHSMAYGMLDLDPLSYAAWAISHSLVSGPDDDDDHDGLSNRAEYMLGGDPKNALDAPHPAIGLAPNGKPSYTLTRNLEALDIFPQIQFSPDLLDWTTHPPVFISSVRQPDGTSVLLFNGPWPMNDPVHSKGYFRTRIATP